MMLSKGTGTVTETKMSLALQLRDYRLTTAEILYRLPDHPDILQTYIWQDLDLAYRREALVNAVEHIADITPLAPNAEPQCVRGGVR